MSNTYGFSARLTAHKNATLLKFSKQGFWIFVTFQFLLTAGQALAQTNTPPPVTPAAAPAPATPSAAAPKASSAKATKKSKKTIAEVKSSKANPEDAKSSGPFLPAGLEGSTVSEVVIQGNKRIERDAIIEKMKLKKGSALTAVAVAQDIQAIFSLGFFEDLRFESDSGKLIVSVKERPVVVAIEYEGVDEFEKKDLDDVVGIKPFTVLNLSKIRSGQSAIAKKYEEKGYYLARSEAQLNPVEGKSGEVKLVLKVTENEKVRIRRIFFFGNKHFTSGDLKQLMITGEGHAFSWMTSTGTFREDAFERDLAVLAYYYGNDGYIQAKFSKPRVTLSQDRRFIDIMIDVEEGKQFYLGNVHFKGSDLLFSESELRKEFGLLEKDVFSTGRLQEEVLKLTEKYGDQGYAFANVIPKPEIREGSDIVDLDLEIEKGEKVYWGKIKVTGNTKTHDKVVRRELPFAEGELYNATKRKRGVEKVRRLGFFGNDVNFLTSTPKGSNNILDLEIKVQDKPTGTLNVSAGYGSGSGFVLQGQVSQNNLFGLGQQLAFSMQYNNSGSKDFSLSFTDPKAFDTEWSMGGDLYIQENSLGGTGATKTYDQRVYGAAYRVGREIREDLSLFGTYKVSESLLYNPISGDIFNPPLSPKDQNSYISSVAATLSYDTRNNRMDPSGGMYATASSEFAGLGGRVFQKYSGAFRIYRRPFWKFTFRTNLEYGLLTNALTDDAVPGAERFILGGVFSLRGYPWSSVGPSIVVNRTRPDAGSGSFPYVIGGTQKAVFNQELEFPLIPEADIRTVLFFDAGQAWNAGSNPSPAVLANYGWGIRWYSPLGPLRFEWGYPLTKLNGKAMDTQFNFIIAPTF